MVHPVSMATRFSYELTILEHHLDTYGHVNNAVYLQILEEARWDLVTKGGWGLERVLKERKGPVILEIQIQFKKELRLRDLIEIQTECLDYSRTVGTMRQTILSKGEVVCTADFKFALFDLDRRRVLRPTEEWLRIIGVDAPSNPKPSS